MSDNILVAYATKCGSTEEVAQAIDRVLRQAGVDVDVAPVQKVKDLSPYSAVVLGTCIRMGKPIGEAMRFAQKQRQALNTRPVALFSVGLSPRDKTPELDQKAIEHMQPLQEIVEPVSLGLFAGKIDHSKLGVFFRFAAKKDKSGTLAEGDWRDWEAIEAWAREMAQIL